MKHFSHPARYLSGVLATLLLSCASPSKPDASGTAPTPPVSESCPLSPGAALLFQNVKSKLTAGEKEAVYQAFGYERSNDGRHFVEADLEDEPFDATVYPTDLNRDGREELFVAFGNTTTSGVAGTSIVLFTKRAGIYKTSLDVPGVVPDALETGNGGYPDLLVGGPGFEYPVWRWNGTEYTLHKTIGEPSLKSMRLKSIDTLSQEYGASF